MLPRSLRFPIRKEGRLLNNAGRRFYTNLFTVVYRKNGLNISRLAFIVGKKISPKAVVRNKIKRQLSDIVRKNIGLLQKPVDVIIIPKPGIINADKEKYEVDIASAFRKISSSLNNEAMKQ